MQDKKRVGKNYFENLRSAIGKFRKSKIVKKSKEIDDVQDEVDLIEYEPIGQDEFDADNDYVEEKIDYDLRILLRLELSKAHKFKQDLVRFVKSWQ